MIYLSWNQLSFKTSIRTLRSRPFCSSLPQLKEYKGVGEVLANLCPKLACVLSACAAKIHGHILFDTCHKAALNYAVW